MPHRTRKQYLETLKGWSKRNPGTHSRTLMMKRCGKKCFLGSNRSFPICAKNTCKIDKAGAQSAYIRAQEMAELANIGSNQKHSEKYYRNISRKALRILSEKKHLKK